MSDQDRISPYNINTISDRHVLRLKKNLNEGVIIYYTIYHYISYHSPHFFPYISSGTDKGNLFDNQELSKL